MATSGTKKKGFDPMAYIENAFLDTPEKDGKKAKKVETTIEGDKAKNGTRFRKTKLSAPRPRKSKAMESPGVVDAELQQLWEMVPRNVEFLSRYFNDSVTSHYYRGGFRETRTDMIRRLLDPELTLEEVSRLLGVCPATVRRYTNRGWLTHHRTTGGQRRFRLAGVVKFVEEHGRLPEE